MKPSPDDPTSATRATSTAVTQLSVRARTARLLHRLPRGLRLVLVLFLANLAIFSLFRIVFWFAFQSTAPDAPTSHHLKSFYLGLKFDMRLSFVLLLPLLIASWIPKLRALDSRWGTRICLGYVTGIMGFCLLMFLIDFPHYDWLHTRLNASSLDFLTEFGIAFTIIWESYPVVWAFLGYGVLVFLYGWAIRRFAFPVLRAESPKLTVQSS